MITIDWEEIGNLEFPLDLEHFGWYCSRYFGGRIHKSKVQKLYPLILKTCRDYPSAVMET